jgi:hypothetical protein
MSEELQGWIGVDLDGTLAEYHGWAGPEHIGKPIPLMVERVKRWHEQGQPVRIMTARVSPLNPNREKCIKAINFWMDAVLGFRLPITHEKDYQGEKVVP